MTTGLIFVAGMFWGACALAVAITMHRDLRARRSMDGLSRDYRSHSEKFARAVAPSLSTPRLKVPLRVVGGRR